MVGVEDIPDLVGTIPLNVLLCRVDAYSWVRPFEEGSIIINDIQFRCWFIIGSVDIIGTSATSEVFPQWQISIAALGTHDPLFEEALVIDDIFHNIEEDYVR